MEKCPICKSEDMEGSDTDEDFEEGFDTVMVTESKCANCGCEFKTIERTKVEVIITKSDVEANFLNTNTKSGEANWQQ